MNRCVGEGDVDSGTEAPPSFEAFRTEAIACGCDEALPREWRPDTVIDTHPFRLRAGTPHAERWRAGV